MSVEIRLRPLQGWPYPKTERRRSAQFRSTWRQTQTLLRTEVEYLGGQLVVVEFDVVGGETAFRVDGSLRANAKETGFPGVRVSFTSRHGPLTYATDKYECPYSGQPPSWQANVRAIALSLEALRAVDRHGVTRRGEQYRGWHAVEAAPGSSFLTADAAARWLAQQAGGPPEGGRILADAEWRRKVLRTVAMRVHPDHGGARADWDRYDEARRLVEGMAS